MTEKKPPKFCENCGNRVQSGDTFCGSCGAAILSPPTQAEQIIPRHEAASHAPTWRGGKLLLPLSGALIVLLVLGVVSVLAFIPSNEDRIEISPDVYSEIPAGWTVATSGGTEGIGIQLVREEFANVEIEDFLSSDEGSTEGAYITVIEDNLCKRPSEPVQADSLNTEYENISGFNETINSAGIVASGDAEVSGSQAKWDVKYQLSAQPWFYDATLESASDYPNYLMQTALEICVDDLDLYVMLVTRDYLSQPPTSNIQDEEPIAQRNASTPEARAEVNENVNAKYQSDITAVISLLENVDQGGFFSAGSTNLSSIPIDLNGLDEVASDPFGGQLEDNAFEESESPSDISPDPDGEINPDPFPYEPPEEETPSAEEEIEAFVFEYYDAVVLGDWATTYSLLADESKLEFTEEEWTEAQRRREAVQGGSSSLESVDIELQESAGAIVTLYFANGTTGTTTISYSPSVDDWRRYLNEEDISYLNDLLSQNEVPDTSDGSLVVEDFVYEYYAAVERSDWSATYSMLADISQQEFTESEWIEVQEKRQAISGPPASVSSVSVVNPEDYLRDPTFVATVSFSDGTSVEIEVVDPHDNTGLLRILTDEEIEYLKSL